MKLIFTILFVIILGNLNCISQTNYILSKEEIPYEKWSETDNSDSIRTFKIVYKSDSLKVCGYISTPRYPGKYPCIIYNRGGNREYGRLTPVNASLHLGKLALKGYIVIASSFRGNDCSEGNDEFGGSDVNDILNLFNILSEIPYADTSRIGMYGVSRGGMMTYLCLPRTNRIKAAVTLGAPSDLKKLAKDRIEMETEVFAQLIPNYSLNKDSELEKRSAIKWACTFPKTCPILVLHGENDDRVSVGQSTKLCKKFSKCKIPYKLKIFEKDNHPITAHRREVDALVIQWFNTYLK